MTKLLLGVLLIASLVVSGCLNPYVKSVKNHLGIQHVYKRPSSAYGPGSVVKYEKKSDYTGTCRAAWLLPPEEEIIVDPIMDVDVKSDATMMFDIKLDAEDYAKVGAKYQNMSKVVMSLSNGHQEEIIPVLSDVWSNVASIPCKENIESEMIGHPKAKFYLVRVVYAYDFKVSALDNTGAKIEGEIPDDVLDVISAKLGMKYESNDEFKLTGKNLYVGFNGDPVVMTNLGAYSRESVGVKEKARARRVIPAVLDITNLIQKQNKK